MFEERTNRASCVSRWPSAALSFPKLVMTRRRFCRRFTSALLMRAMSRTVGSKRRSPADSCSECPYSPWAPP